MLFWYGAYGELLEITPALDGANASDWIYFAGQRIARQDPSAVYYMYGDALGSLRTITDATGNIVRNSDYYPFGSEDWLGGSGYDANQFAGLYRDSEDLNDSATYRRYTISLGRWLSPDPLAGDISNPQSLNRYAYALNNPTNLADPLGLDPIQFGCTGGMSSWVDPIQGAIQVDSWAPCPGDTSVVQIDDYGVDPSTYCAMFDGVDCGYGNPSPYYGNANTSGGGNGGNTTTKPGSTPSSTVKTVAKTIGNYIPVPCGGGLFNYGGLQISGDVASVSVSKIHEADFTMENGTPKAAYLEGPFAEITLGELVQGGYGRAYAHSANQSLGDVTSPENFTFLGVGGDAGAASGNVSAFYATPGSFGISLSGSLFSFEGGVGAYLNIKSASACYIP